ncbi:type II toxin-antitoxin system Phd/YefM family antitoxin [Atlantibacter hermannii]|uniref:type II toxin-antitoxin system Phd/YefM family antitoxin n=1 Tax=Atlantibacter hermannii TaxID=565 RepID=UPI00324C6000
MRTVTAQYAHDNFDSLFEAVTEDAATIEIENPNGQNVVLINAQTYRAMLSALDEIWLNAPAKRRNTHKIEDLLSQRDFSQPRSEEDEA